MFLLHNNNNNKSYAATQYVAIEHIKQYDDQAATC